MTDCYNPDNENIKPGGRIAFGGGMIDRHRKIHDVPDELIQTAIRAYDLLVRSGWDHNKHSYDFGVSCNDISEYINHGDWKPFRDLHLNMISDSTIDRARKIASNIKIDPYSSFLSVAQDPLTENVKKILIR